MAYCCGCQCHSYNGLPLWVSESLIQWLTVVGVSITYPMAYHCGCQCHSCNGLPLWVSVLYKSNGLPLWVSVSLIQWLTTVSSVTIQIVCNAISSCTMAILWYLNRIDEANPDMVSVVALRGRIDVFMKNCHDLLFYQNTKVAEEVFSCHCHYYYCAL